MFRDLVRFDHKRGRWLIADRHRWRADDGRQRAPDGDECCPYAAEAAANADLARAERERLFRWGIRSEGATRLEAMLKVASSMPPIADSGESWDATAGLLGVPNGVVDLRTGKLRDGQPEDRITMHAGVEYDPHPECPRWERLNAEVCSEDAALAAYLKRMAGYTATGEANLALLLFLMGVGSNGKSLYLKVLTLGVRRLRLQPPRQGAPQREPPTPPDRDRRDGRQAAGDLRRAGLTNARC